MSVTTLAVAETPGINPIMMTLTIVGIVVSIGAAIITVALWVRGGPRLKVAIGTATLIATKPGETSRGAITLKVVNTGRASTVVSSWHFETIMGTDHLGPRGSITTGGPELPHTLQPHERAFWWVDSNQARHELLDDPQQDVRLRAVVVYGPKTKKTRKSVRLYLPSANPPREKGWRAAVARLRYRFRRGLLCYIVTSHEGTPMRRIGDVLLVIASTAWAPLTNVHVKATSPDRERMSPLQQAALQREQHHRRIIRKRWNIPVTEEMLSLADDFEIWWRIDYRGGGGAQTLKMSPPNPGHLIRPDDGAGVVDN